ncbi:MAG TPA: hypothetical protein DDZ51_00200 [Planctomycetaceae bacterium]|nr:hypothetical protein [Planctomycetaceae bacterium]
MSDIRLKPPPIDRFVRPISEPSLGGFSAAHGRAELGLAGVAGPSESEPTADIPLPLFWYDPPWHHADIQRRLLVAQIVGDFGVTVNVLHRELQGDNAEWGEATWSRMATHRSDRLGWTLEDAQSARIIELRLGMNRDERGGYSYQSEQLGMWLDHDSEYPVEPLRPEPLMFPPEWSDLSQMGSKVTQLRRLGCGAVYVSIDDGSVESALPAIAAAEADGIIVRFDKCPLASLMAYRRWAATHAASRRPRLWLAGGALTAEEAVKCFALGASAISIDSICDRWLLGDNGSELSIAERSAMNLGFNMGPTPQQRLSGNVQRTLSEFCRAIAAQVQSLAVTRLDDLTADHLIGVQ